MPITGSVKTTGGKKLEAILKKAEQPRRKQVKVGFFSTAKYDDGTPVAANAAIQEFGLGASIPERPFFRQSIAIIEQELPAKLAKIIDPATMEVSAADAAKIGEYAKETIQGRIRDFKDPPNAEGTILQKGSDSPLQDTDKMLNSVDYETE
jgi:hypothetical protein